MTITAGRRVIVQDPSKRVHCEQRFWGIYTIRTTRLYHADRQMIFGVGGFLMEG